MLKCVKLFIWMFLLSWCCFYHYKHPFWKSFCSIPLVWYIVFPFSLVARYFLIFHLISSLINWLFRSVLFNFHTFANFLASFYKFLILQKLQKILIVTLIFINFLRLFVTCHMIYPGKCSLWTWEECVFCCTQWNTWNVVHICLLGPFSLKYSSSPMFHDWFSVWMIHPLLKVEYEVPYYYDIVVYFSLEIS